MSWQLCNDNCEVDHLAMTIVKMLPLSEEVNLWEKKDALTIKPFSSTQHGNCKVFFIKSFPVYLSYISIISNKVMLIYCLAL